MDEDARVLVDVREATRRTLRRCRWFVTAADDDERSGEGSLRRGDVAHVRRGLDASQDGCPRSVRSATAPSHARGLSECWRRGPNEAPSL